MQTKLGIIIITVKTDPRPTTDLGVLVMRSRYKALAVVLALGVTLLASACSSSIVGVAGSSGSGGKIVAVGAENEYADVIAQAEN